MKKVLFIALLLFVGNNVFALEYNDILTPKEPAYRLGISDTPEKVYIQNEYENIVKEYVKKDTSIEHSSNELTFADLSLQQISKEIAEELLLSEKNMVADLSLLWRGAAVQSDTINFALYKLANPEADKPNDKSVKKVLATIANMSTIVGAGMGSPIMAASTLIGSNVLGIMTQDTKELNYKYSKVNDADMIILVRKIEDLQQRAVDLYYDYMTAKKQLEMYDKLVAQRKRNYELAQNSSREIIIITDAYYRSSLNEQEKARSNFMAKRAALEQFVGNEVFVQFEKEVAGRKQE